MRQSLAVAADCGQSTESITEQKRRLLSTGSIEDLLALTATLYGSARMAAGDDADDDADDADDDAEDGDDDGDDGDDDADDEGDKKVDDPKDARIVELSKEAKKKRMRIRSQAQRIADLEAENARLKGKGKDSGKDDDGDADDAPNPLEQENQQLKQKLVQQSLQFEFTALTTGPQAKVKFKNPKTAFKLLDLDEVDVDDDGTFDGLEDAIAALAKSDPYLVEDAKDDEGKPPARRVGQPTGSRSKGANPNREKLLKKYPALRR